MWRFTWGVDGRTHDDLVTEISRIDGLPYFLLHAAFLLTQSNNNNSFLPGFMVLYNVKSRTWATTLASGQKRRLCTSIVDSFLFLLSSTLSVSNYDVKPEVWNHHIIIIIIIIVILKGNNAENIKMRWNKW